MYACEKYFSDDVLKQMEKCKTVIIIGLSVGMCNTVSYLLDIGYKNIAVYDRLFCENPEISLFKGVKIIHNIDQLDMCSCYFIITEFSKRSAQHTTEMLLKEVLHENILVISSSREIRIEASGLCNLHCMSCQCGNYDSSYFSFKDRKAMTLPMCTDIIKKVLTDYPDNTGIFYYIFGEPLLAPELPDMVHIAKNSGLSVVISTNLSLKKDLKPLLDSCPDILKISVSGYTNEVYRHHHNGGDIELVHDNMKQIYDILRKAENVQTTVVVGYHIYSDNKGEELEQTRKLCQNYGFIFAPVKAIYNNPLKRMGVSSFTTDDLNFLRNYYDDPQSYFAFEETMDNFNIPCRNIDNKLFIDYDGRIMLCELLHKDTVFKKYTELTLEEIDMWRKNHPMCSICRRHGLQLF